MENSEHNSKRAPEGPILPEQGRLPERRIYSLLIASAILVGAAVALAFWHPWQYHASPPTSSAQPTATQPVAAGWLHTSGTAILSSDNRSVRFTGVDEGRMIDGQGNTPDRCGETWHAPSAADAAQIRALGLNTVRLGISWANIEPTAPTLTPNGQLEHHWNEQYLAALDKVIAQYQAQGLWVILDMHQVGFSTAFSSNGTCEGHGLPSWLFPQTGTTQAAAKCDFFTDQTTLGEPEKLQEGLGEAWSMLAARYKADNTVVAADMYNEPQWDPSCHGVDLAAFYQKIGSDIRAQNPNILLAEEDGAYENYLKNGFLLKQAPALPNTIYSWHFYPPDWNTGEPYLQAHFQQAQTWNIPLWIGEFDAFHAGTNGSGRKNKTLDPNWQSDLTAMMSYCQQNHISWIFWEWDRNSSLIQNGAPKQPLTTLLAQGADSLPRKP